MPGSLGRVSDRVRFGTLRGHDDDGGPVVIDEETIMSHLDILLSGSEPGATMHHLHVLAAPAGAVGPLGMPDQSQVHSTVYAIAADHPDSGGRAEDFIARVVGAAAVEAHREGRVVLFAALSQEVWTVPGVDELAARLLREGRLFEHPRAAEMTVVYAVCRDGRRWTGKRLLTGPDAGKTADVELLVGRPDRGEGYAAGALLRRLVGMGGVR